MGSQQGFPHSSFILPLLSSDSRALIDVIPNSIIEVLIMLESELCGCGTAVRSCFSPIIRSGSLFWVV